MNTQKQIEAQQQLIASRVDDGTYEANGGLSGPMAEMDEAVLRMLAGMEPARVAVHVGRYYDEQTIDVSGIANHDHGYADKGFVVLKARTEKQAVDVFVDVDKARELRKALDRAIRAADPQATKDANWKARQRRWEKRRAEFRTAADK